MSSSDGPRGRARRAWVVAVALVAAAAGFGLVIQSRRHGQEPAATRGAAPTGSLVADAGRPIAAATSSAAADGGRAGAALPSAASALPPEVFAAVAELAARVDGCPLAAARAPRAHPFIRFELTSDLRLAAVHLVDPAAAAADLADDCFRAAVGAPHHLDLDAGAQTLTVFWPVGPVGPVRPVGPAVVAARDGDADGGGAAPDQDRGAPASQRPMRGVDLLVVPYAQPRAGLPAGAFARPWLALCGPQIDRATPRPVRLTGTPNEENSDFVDVAVAGCGRVGPAEVVAFRGAKVAASIGTAPARIRAIADSPSAETEILFGGARYRLWQLRSGRTHGVLALRAGATVQVLAADEDPEWDYALVWAGDLDRDGRLDLIVRDDEPDEGRYRLFLSGGQQALPVLFAAEAQLPGD